MVLPQVRFIIGHSPSVEDKFLTLQEALSAKDFELACVSCWAIWNDRNAIRAQAQVPDGNCRSEWIRAYMKEFEGCWQVKHVSETNLQLSSFRTFVSVWVPPPAEWVKLNVDAACKSEISRTGIGVIGRNCGGKFLQLWPKISMRNLTL